MAALTENEKAFNAWWKSRFDADAYKTIRLFNHGQLIQTYTTANGRYNDAEDAASAYWTANQMHVTVTSVAIGSKRYKLINGKIRQIAGMEAGK